MAKKYRAPLPPHQTHGSVPPSDASEMDEQLKAGKENEETDQKPNEDSDEDIKNVIKYSKLPSGGSRTPIVSFSSDFWKITCSTADQKKSSLIPIDEKTTKFGGFNKFSSQPRVESSRASNLLPGSSLSLDGRKSGIENVTKQFEQLTSSLKKKHPLDRRTTFRHISPAISKMVQRFEGSNSDESADTVEASSVHQSLPLISTGQTSVNPNLRTPTLPLSNKSEKFVSTIKSKTSDHFETQSNTSSRSRRSAIDPTTAKVLREATNDVSSLISFQVSKRTLNRPEPPTRVSSLRNPRYRPIDPTRVSPKSVAISRSLSLTESSQLGQKSLVSASDMPNDKSTKESNEPKMTIKQFTETHF